MLLGELLRIDDHAVLSDERQEVLHALPAHRDLLGGGEGDEGLEQRGAVDRLVAERRHHFRQAELDQLDFTRLDTAELERLAELGGAGDAFAHDREFAALEILEVADGAREVAADRNRGKAEALGDLALVGDELHADAAREGVEQRGRHRRAAHLHLAGGEGGENLRRRLEADDLDIETFVAEVSFFLRNEDAGIRHRADGADLDRDPRAQRRGLRHRARDQ